LILGALLAVLGTRVSAWLKKPADEADLARAIHTELADRVARCCFDFEDPWHEYGINPEAIDSNRLRKFAPYDPIVYPALAGQIAMLPDGPLQCLLKFYFRLAAWQRDAENTADVYPDKLVQEAEVKRLSRRLRETLKPGLDALDAFTQLVREPCKIEDELLAAYDTFRRDNLPYYRPARSLRERLADCIAGTPLKVRS